MNLRRGSVCYLMRTYSVEHEIPVPNASCEQFFLAAGRFQAFKRFAKMALSYAFATSPRRGHLAPGEGKVADVLHLAGVVAGDALPNLWAEKAEAPMSGSFYWCFKGLEGVCVVFEGVQGVWNPKARGGLT